MQVPVNLENLHKRYGRVPALDGVTLAAREGEVLGLLGHNGAGKTTIMKLVLGLTRPDSGRVEVLGLDPHGRDARRLRHRVGYLPENVVFYGELTGREVLRYFARLKGLGMGVSDRLLERLGLARAADRPVKGYSNGMRQRLGLAQALLGEPALLLLDEPTAGLDPDATRDVYAMLDELRGQGATVILSSHVLAGIEKHIDRAAIIGAGRLLASGKLEDLGQRAGLGVTIRAGGDWADEKRLDALMERGAVVHRRSATELELRVPGAAKLDVLRVLLAVDGIRDLAVESPSLEMLYDHFGPATRPAEAPCAAS
jgi:Cu-processing system ATP-binding protein